MSSPEEPITLGEPVRAGRVLVTVVHEIVNMAREVDARRRFDADVAAWLKEYGLTADFEAWRKARVAESLRDVDPTKASGTDVHG